jgi:hypothetical protein
LVSGWLRVCRLLGRKILVRALWLKSEVTPCF